MFLFGNALGITNRTRSIHAANLDPKYSQFAVFQSAVVLSLPRLRRCHRHSFSLRLPTQKQNQTESHKMSWICILFCDR